MRGFEDQEDGIPDRGLIVLELFGNGGSRLGDKSLPQEVAQGMGPQFDVGADGFSIILIGEDGTVRFRSLTSVSVSELFGLIDTMPMRQQEMLRKRKADRIND